MSLNPFGIKGRPAFDLSEGRNQAQELSSKMFLGSTGKTALNMVKRYRGQEMLPKIFSDSPQYMELLKRISDDLSDVKDDVREDGFYGPTAMKNDFGAVRTISGFGMDPGSYPMIGNNVLREKLGLAPTFKSRRDVAIFDKLCKVLYTHKDFDKRTTVSASSTSGAPFYLYGMEEKHKLNLFYAMNKDDIIDLTIKGEFVELYNKYKIILYSSDGVRYQPDTVNFKDGKWKSKDREVNDYEYARSQGQTGRTFLADKTFYRNGIAVEGFATMRKRRVDQYPKISFIVSVLVESFRTGSEKRYSKVFKCRTRDELLSELKPFKHVLPLDVKSFDLSIGWFFMDRWTDNLPLPDREKLFIKIIHQMPSLNRFIGNSKDPILSGDPFNKEFFNQWSGLPSGSPVTSMFGKFCFVFQILVMIDYLCGDVFEKLESYLDWESQNCVFKDTGDDSLIATNNSKLFFQFHQMLKGEMPFVFYFKAELEFGAAYLGNILYKDEKNELNVCGSVNSLLVKLLAHERGMGLHKADGSRIQRKPKFRKFPVFGALNRLKSYQDNPSFELVDGVLQKHFYDIYKKKFWDWMMEFYEEPKEFSGRVLNPAELEVIADPSKLFYKYDASDIGKEVMDVYMQKVDEKSVSLILKDIKYTY